MLLQADSRAPHMFDLRGFMWGTNLVTNLLKSNPRCPYYYLIL
jgi:hypothetical protein